MQVFVDALYVPPWAWHIWAEFSRSLPAHPVAVSAATSVTVPLRRVDASPWLPPVRPPGRGDAVLSATGGGGYGTLVTTHVAIGAHSITWSARCRSDGGIVRPRALAVLRLMTSSNLVACSIGKSAGLAPLRILST